MASASSSIALAGGVAVSLLRRPHLVAPALRMAWSLVPDGWWRTSPRLPIPHRSYMDFRLTTLSGDPDELPSVDDVIVYLEWCRSMRALPDRA